MQIRNVEIAQNNSDIIIVSRTSEIEKSTDGGISFTNIRNNLPNHMIQDIAINPNDDNDIIVVNASFTDNSEKVFRSINGGASWINITHNIGDIPVHTVVIDHTNNPKIYIGTEVGVYYMPLDGNNWVLYSPDLPNVAIEELEINYGANTLKAATWGRGLWEYDLVDRASYPSIESTSITDPVSLNSPLEESYQYVTSEIIYDGNLTDVKVIFSINNQSFDNSINMSNASGDVWVSDQAIPNSALSGDKVYFKVIATGANNDTSSTYKLMYKVSEFMYCSSVGLTGTTSDFINQVRLGDFVNDSDQNYYTLYDNLEPIELNVGETYELSVRLDYAFNLDNAAVWIDFNRNAIFDDTELITMSQYNNNISNGSFTVPDDVVYGQNLRMRVSNIYDNISDPCGNAYGEVEDYVIIVNNTLDIDNFDENDRTVSVYPNPSSSDIFLKSSENILKVELYDLRGRKIIQQNNLNKFETQFNVEHLKEAIYILNVYTKEKIIVKKIVKKN